MAKGRFALPKLLIEISYDINNDDDDDDDDDDNEPERASPPS